MRAANTTRASTAATWTPVPASGACNILPLGTSITFGKYGDNTNDPSGGFRGPLFSQCKRANPNVDFVGPQSGPTGTGSGHAGLPGVGIAGMAAVLGGYLTTYTPHIVLVELGTNDTDTTTDATACATTIVDAILAARPNALVLCSSTLPYFSGKATFNAQLALEIANRRAAGKHVEFIDQFRQSGLVLGPTDFSDYASSLWVHPTASGYPKMVAPIYASLAKYWR